MNYLVKYLVKGFISLTYLKVLNAVIYISVLRKFKQDAKVLPLTNKHKKLYFIIHNYYFKKFYKFPNIIDCNDINEKIQWLKLFDQTELHTICSDKLLLKEFVKKKLNGEYFPHTYQSVDKFNDFEFNSMPENYVMKTNHDSGTYSIVKKIEKNISNKFSLDKLLLKSKIKLALNKNFGYETGEWAYTFVKRKVFTEELLMIDNSIADYKFYVVDGKVKFCHYIFDRETSPKEQIVLPDGRLTQYRLHKKFGTSNSFNRPKNWKRLIEIAEKLGEQFKFVRVDLYSIQNRAYVGEMTFWPQAGCYKGKDIKHLGDFLNFNRDDVYEPIFN